MRARPQTLLTLSLPALLLSAAWLHAGPLDPPPGPVASTGKTLAETEPRIAINATNTPGNVAVLFRITQPGSYYLTGNVTGVANRSGIEIAASGVTIDLNGFELVGVPGSHVGIYTSADVLRDLDIRNGSVRDWGNSGVDLGTRLSTSSVITGLRTSGNGQTGLRVGRGSVITRCVSTYNGGSGILCEAGAVLDGCVSGSNTGAGFTAGTICVFTNCSAWLNGSHGIHAAESCVVRGCTVSNNSAIGVFLGARSTVAGCVISANAGDGIAIGNGSVVAECSSHSNGGSGFVGNSGSTIRQCSAYSNTGDGIRVLSECLVAGNTCSLNGNGTGNGAGIRAESFRNRIEGNHCSSADVGIVVTSFNNVLSRNTCSFNTLNWDIAASNICLVVVGQSGAAISGNSGGVPPGSADPNANFSY